MHHQLVVFAKALESTRLSWALSSGLPWVWPTAETLHFLGMALLIGAIGVLDARMLGLFKAIPLGALERLVPWGILGFGINLFTGVIFFIAAPSQYVLNLAFWFKMGFVALAGINVSLFYFTGLARKVDRLGPGESAPWPAKLIAASSIFLWFGVLYWGRMLPFIGNAF